MNMVRLLTKIFNLPNLLRASWSFEEAWDLFARNKPEEAEKRFEKAETYIKTLPYEYKIMKGTIKSWLDKHNEAVSLYESAWNEINSDLQLPVEDNLYLKLYMFHALEVYKNTLDKNLDWVTPVTGNDVPLKNVSTKWKRRFPYREHPDWERYGV